MSPRRHDHASGLTGSRLTEPVRVGLRVAADAAAQGRHPATVALGRLLEAAPWATTAVTGLDETVSEGAGCVHTDPETWFPPAGDRHDGSPELRARERERAGRLCAGCPVTAPCLALSYALDTTGAHGVWGGLSATDRRELRPLWAELGRRLTPPRPAPHAAPWTGEHR